MKNKRLPTLSIGIPAHNEEENIAKLLRSIMSQSRRNFTLEKIIIATNGCTDKTNDIVRTFKKKYEFIQHVDEKIRLGKASALNTIYKLSNSDFLLTIDADVIFLDKNNLELMIREMIDNPDLNMVSPLHIPTTSDTFFGNLSRFSYLIFRDAALKIDNGNNFYSSMSSEFMRKKFYRSFLFPEGTISDQGFAYAMAIKNGKKGFKVVKNAKVIFGVAQTFRDWRILSTRSVVGDRADIVKRFGKKVLKDYAMPKKLYIFSLLKYFFLNPVYAIGAVLMNIYIRKFPYKKTRHKKGMWEMVLTSKRVAI